MSEIKTGPNGTTVKLEPGSIMVGTFIGFQEVQSVNAKRGEIYTHNRTWSASKDDCEFIQKEMNRRSV